LINGRPASASKLKQLTFKQQLLAMAGKTAWTAQHMVAWAKGWLKNIVFYRVLLMIFWALAFLVPRALLVLAYTLKAYADLTGRELKFGNNSKDMD
jgi:hypothetical protein